MVNKIRTYHRQTDNKIVSLQALRALAFFGIFLEHAGATTLKWAALGVSIFFVLSGYLMYYRYENRDMQCSVKENLRLSLSKIKKLYPLHIITMCLAAMLILSIYFNNGITIKNIVVLVVKIGLNITLLQTWVPYSPINVSLNGVAWYLSVTMFLYFMFPYLRRYIQKNKNKNLIIAGIFILFLEIISCIPFIMLLGENSNVYIWFMYCFPVFRLGDFFIGCCLGKLIKGNWYDFTLIQATIIEVLATVLTVLVYAYTKINFQNVFLLATQNWTTLYIPLATIWILLFVKKQGIITKVLTNRITIFIGDISAYLFLIHYVVTQYVQAVIIFLNLQIANWQNIVLIELLLSILGAVLYKKICAISYLSKNHLTK